MPDAHWLSAHVHFPGGLYTEVCDGVILHCLAPFVRRCERAGWIEGWFFIRYGLEGPHVRLRLRGRPDALESRVRPALLRHAGESSASLRVRWSTYEPELERYGGPDAITTSEACFQASSETALALLEGLPAADRSARLGKGLLTMMTLLHVFRQTRDAAGALAHRYATGYLRTVNGPHEGRTTHFLEAFGHGFDHSADALTPYVEEAWSRLSLRQPLTPALDRYRRALQTIRDRLFDLRRPHVADSSGAARGRSPLQVMPSYMHMMNNRLGLTIPEESYLAYLISRTLAAPACA